MILIRSDARHLPLADESVQCCVTSPPYWGLRSYEGDPNMIGLEATFDEHLANLVAVFREVRRVLRTDGTVWLNYGDAYAANGQPGGFAIGSAGVTVDGNRSETRAAAGVVKRAAGIGLKPKDLMMMPARVAMALQAPHLKCRGCGHVAHESRWGRWPNRRRIGPSCEKSKGKDVETPGWWLRSEIIWHKPNPMPESVTDRPTNSHEKVFLLTKSARYFYDAEAVRTPSNGWAGDFAPKSPDRMENQKFGGTRNAQNQSIGANLRNVWKIPTQSVSDAHFATFPEKLVEPCILAGTSAEGACAKCGAPWVRAVETTSEYKDLLGPGTAWDHAPDGSVRRQLRSDPAQVPTNYNTTGWNSTCSHEAPTVPCTVLDPFVGSGTVCRVATRLNRRGIGCDLGYQEIAVKRTTNVQRMLL